jgi:arabinose-5-phosphate isomerase
MTLRVVPLESVQAVQPNVGLLDAARTSILHQANALTKLANRIDDDFSRAVELILECTGRVVVSGMGKSGLVGRKLAATLNCSGTPSIFLHPGEAAHGDLGMVTAQDLLVIISNSGETTELVTILPYFVELGIPIVALVGQQSSSIGRAATVALDISVDRESCPHNLVPTTSALVTLATGDALAMAAMVKRGFTAQDFGRFHPGGALGTQLSNRVRDVMQTQQLPLVPETRLLGEALLPMSSGRCGLVIVTDHDGKPLGIVTDGDLRRALQHDPNALHSPVSAFMTRKPVTVRDDATIREAEERMHRLRLKALVVVDTKQQVVGVIEIFNGR